MYKNNHGNNLLEENTKLNLHDLGLCNDILAITSTSQQ